MVESGGTRGKGHVLPKEISLARAGEKSAAAIVAMKDRESGSSEGPKERNHDIGKAYGRHESHLKPEGVTITITTRRAEQAWMVKPSPAKTGAQASEGHSATPQEKS